MHIYAYKRGSKSAKDLANSLGCKRIKHNNSRFVGRATKKVVNWGSSSLPEAVSKCLVINKPQAVDTAACKLKFFNKLKVVQGISLPLFTTDQDEVRDGLNDGETWVARTKLRGNSGDGLVVMESLEEFVEAPLYTMYTPKKEEYRIHVIGGRVVSKQRKARSRDVPDEEVNWKVRNLAGGFIFARNEEHNYPDCVLEQALLAVEGCGLDFGAVDVIYNERNNKAYVLEVNTAPGLVGTTLDVYAEELSKYVYK